MDFFQIKTESFSVIPTVVFTVFDIPFTGSMLTGLLLTVLMSIFAIIVSRKLTIEGTPGKVQAFLEILYSALFGLVEKISGGTRTAKQIMPIIIAIVLFIALSNTFSNIPFFGSIQYEGNNLFTTNTKDLNTTLGLSITAVLWTHYLSIKKINLFRHVLKFIKIDAVFNGFKKGIGAGLLSIIDLFIGVLDIISEFAKTLSLSLRLFGNMFAGEILTALLLGLFTIIVPLPIMFYGTFSGLVQSIIFGALLSSYFGGVLGGDQEELS